MAQKKAARPSSKKGKTSKAASTSKTKTSTAKKKSPAKVKTKAKPKKTTASPKKATATKVKTKPGTKKIKPKAAKPTKKATAKKKVVQKASTISTKKKPVAKKSAAKKPTAPKSQPPKKPELSPIDRYNIGGLLACAIDKASDPGLQKLRKALKHLGLSTQEQENLVRQTQGFMIPKLFADEFQDEATRDLAVKELVGFARKDGNYERDWESDLKQFAIWLGIVI